MSATYELRGLTETMAALQAFPASIRNRHIRPTLEIAGRRVKEGAARRAPTGANKLLKKSMSSKVSRKKSNGEFTAVIGVGRGNRLAKKKWSESGVKRTLSKKATKTLAGQAGTQFSDPARYLHLVEKGTKGHTVAAKGRVLAGRVRTAKSWSRKIRFFGKSVRVSAKPAGFMYATFSTDGPVAMAAVGRDLKDAVEHEARMAARATVDIKIQ